MTQSVWDMAEDEFAVERIMVAEGECMIDHWILSYPDGTRRVTPFHCGTCQECLTTEANKVRGVLISMSVFNPLTMFIGAPRSADIVVSKIPTSDYVRFPSVDGLDYLFSSHKIGNGIENANIDWTALVKRREGTRRTGRLITIKKEEPAQLLTIETNNIRASSRDVSISAIREAEKMLNARVKDGIILETVSAVEVMNNAANECIIKYLESNNAFVFEVPCKRDLELPVTFKVKTAEREKENGYI